MIALVNYSMAAVYLLNKRYMPFYKWAHRGIENLPRLSDSYPLYLRLVQGGGIAEIEEISSLIIAEIRHQSLCKCESDFLLDHCPDIQSRISLPELRNISLMEEL